MPSVLAMIPSGRSTIMRIMTECRIFHLHGVAATRSLAASLARALPPGVLVLLRGNLGAGKTSFAQGMAQGLGIEEPVISPTFILIREYPLPESPGRPERFVHLDLYRLNGPAELPGLGLDELIDDDALVAMEWPERGEGKLPEAQVEVTLRSDPEAMQPMGPSRRAEVAAWDAELADKAVLIDKAVLTDDAVLAGEAAPEPRIIEILARGIAIPALRGLSSEGEVEPASGARVGKGRVTDG